MRTTKILTVSVPPKMVKEVETFAQTEGMTKSEFLRDAVRQYIRRKRWEKIRLYGAKKAIELGVKNDDDIERLVDEYRSEQKTKRQ